MCPVLSVFQDILATLVYLATPVYLVMLGLLVIAGSSVEIVLR